MVKLQVLDPAGIVERVLLFLFFLDVAIPRGAAGACWGTVANTTRRVHKCARRRGNCGFTNILLQ